MNATFHQDSGIEQVHNISMCRKERSWIEIDDAQIRKSNSLEVLKVFIHYFYKRILIKMCIKHIMKYICKFYMKQCLVMY